MLKEQRFSDRLYLFCEKMEEAGIKNCFTSKLGGESRGKINGLNLGFRVGDDEERVLKNYSLLFDDLGLSLSNAVAAAQTHTDNIRIVEKADMGKGITKESDISDTDGLICGEKNIPLVVYSADCFGVLLADKNKKAVAAVHLGWRGTEKKISAKAARMMMSNFGVSSEDIIAAIGPGIGACCFETENDTASRFDEKYVKSLGGGKFKVDLLRVIKDDLKNCGLKEENIFSSERCTVCENDIFYSYRSHKEKTGRMGAVICL